MPFRGDVLDEVAQRKLGIAAMPTVVSPFQPRPRPLARLDSQCAYGYNVYAILTGIAKASRGGQDHEECRIAHTTRVKGSAQLNEAFCALVYKSIAAQLDFDKAVAAIPEMHNRIALQAVTVTVMGDEAVMGIHVCSKVSYA